MDWILNRRLFLSIFLVVVFIQMSEGQGVSYEGALRDAVRRTSGITSETKRIAAEMQAFSEYLSPAFSAFEDLPAYTGCHDAYKKGVRKSGVYPISLVGLRPFRAWCDFDGTGGWMVIQRRLDGTVDFFKRWAEYEQGFGNLWGEYWLGLSKISQMTRGGPQLSVYMEAFDGDSGWANYSSFSVGGATTKYTLTASGHSGTIADGLFAGNGQMFTTWDQDNDQYVLNCAEKYLGAWWHNACFSSSLNGRYEKGPSESRGTSNCWNGFKGYYYGLKVSIMRIRA